MGYVHTLHALNIVLLVGGDDRNRFQHIIKSKRECQRACMCVCVSTHTRVCAYQGVRHVVSTLRSCNKTSAAAAANRAEQRGGSREGDGGREEGREGGGDGEKSFHDKNCPLTVR